MHPEERRDAESLLKVERIQMLLKMLEWPGIKRSLTEYMSLEYFKKRPVLPDPLHVKDTGAGGARNKQPKKKPSTHYVYHSGTMTRYILKIKLESEAAFGRGDGVAGLVDAEVQHDDYGFPFLHGRTIKGLLVQECADIRTSLSSGRSMWD
jgi:hypothetical protein